jgi:putative resolvase
MKYFFVKLVNFFIKSTIYIKIYLMKYKISQYARKNNVTVRTVWNWIKLDKVKTERTTTNGWLIVEDEDRIPRRVFIYARVLSSENKSNLDKQKDRLISYCMAKGYKIDGIITEIGSGLNDKRPKLERILNDKTITHIVVEHKDRIARFGMNYIENLLKLNNRTIEIVNNSNNDNNKIELINDLKYIISNIYYEIKEKNINKTKLNNIIKDLELNIC